MANLIYAGKILHGNSARKHPHSEFPQISKELSQLVVSYKAKTLADANQFYNYSFQARYALCSPIVIRIKPSKKGNQTSLESRVKCLMCPSESHDLELKNIKKHFENVHKCYIPAELPWDRIQMGMDYLRECSTWNSQHQDETAMAIMRYTMQAEYAPFQELASFNKDQLEEAKEKLASSLERTERYVERHGGFKKVKGFSVSRQKNTTDQEGLPDRHEDNSRHSSDDDSVEVDYC